MVSHRGHERGARMPHTLSEANNPNGLAFQLNADKSTSFPFSRLDTRKSIWYVPCHRHQQSDCVFGSGANVSTGAVHHDHAQLRGSLDIDIVNTNSCSCNNLELLCSGEKFCCHFSLGSNEERFIIGYDLDQLLRRQAFPFVDIECGS